MKFSEWIRYEIERSNGELEREESEGRGDGPMAATINHHISSLKRDGDAVDEWKRRVAFAAEAGTLSLSSSTTGNGLHRNVPIKLVHDVIADGIFVGSFVGCVPTAYIGRGWAVEIGKFTADVSAKNFARLAEEF